MMQVEEIFVEIPGYPNYQVSNYGVVINAVHDKELKPWGHSAKKTKLMVKLWHAGVPQNFFVHRLVAEAFFLDFDGDCDVLHISTDFTDNCVTNLHLIARE